MGNIAGIETVSVDRRGFMKLAAAGVLAGREILNPQNASSQELQSMAPEALPLFSAEVASEAELLSGPGNNEFASIATVGSGNVVSIDATFRDFVRAQVEIIEDVDGEEVPASHTGFVYRGAFTSLPEGLPELSVENVPWKRHVFVSPDAPDIIDPADEETTNTGYDYKRRLATLELNPNGDDTRFDMILDSGTVQNDQAFHGIMFTNSFQENGQNSEQTLAVFRKKNGWFLLHNAHLPTWESLGRITPGDDGKIDISLIFRNDGINTSVINNGLDSSQLQDVVLPLQMFRDNHIIGAYAFRDYNTPLTIESLSANTPPSGIYAP